MPATWRPVSIDHVVNVADPRLNRALVRDAYRYATVTEYAAAAGMPPPQVQALLAPAVSARAVRIEPFRGQQFVLTGPLGRPIRPPRLDIAPNAWEPLRAGRSLPEAFALWVVLRQMEAAGWVTVLNLDAFRVRYGPWMTAPAWLLRLASDRMVPVVVGPDLGSGVGALLADAQRAGIAVVGWAVPFGVGRKVVDLVDRWANQRPRGEPLVAVLVLEAPTFLPVVAGNRGAAGLVRPDWRLLGPGPGAATVRR